MTTSQIGTKEPAVSGIKDLLISADSHVVEDPDLWKSRLSAGLRDSAPSYPPLSVGGAFQAHAGGHDPHERIKEMAVDGVSGEILYPSLAMDQYSLEDAKLQEACFRVYNDWIIEYCSVAPDRLFGIAMISTYDADNAVAELQRCKNSGLRGAMIWQAPPEQLASARSTTSASGPRLKTSTCRLICISSPARRSSPCRESGCAESRFRRCDIPPT